MSKINNICICLVFCWLSFCANSIVAQTSGNYDSTRNLLTGHRISLVDNRFATLFQIGDERIEDLIKGLDDSDENVKSNAQLIIRYLGNEKGLNAIYEGYKTKSREFRFSCPVPPPVRDWDYQFISSILKDEQNLHDVLLAYADSLILDDSPKAATVLREITERFRKRGDNDVVAKYEKWAVANKTLVAEDNLEKMVLKNAFFLSPGALENAQVKLVALNGKKDKAFIEIDMIGATYHIIISKTGQEWKYQSIILAGIS